MPSRPYHHGNLRQTLLDAAIRLIAQAGPTGFTLREVARRAGVSHNAPYRHFRDKDDLIAAVATQGFKELTAAMLQTAEDNTHPLDRLRAAGLGYVAFALRRPEHFTVMFDASIKIADYAETAAAAHEAFTTLVAFIEACQRDGHLPPGDPLHPALVSWSQVHGIAKLAITGRLPFRSKLAILQFTESALKSTLCDIGPVS